MLRYSPLLPGSVTEAVRCVRVGEEMSPHNTITQIAFVSFTSSSSSLASLIPQSDSTFDSLNVRQLAQDACVFINHVNHHAPWRERKKKLNPRQNNLCQV